MKLTEALTNMLISSLIKKGVLYEARNCDMEFEIPTEGEKNIKIKFKCEHMKLSIEKD